MCGICGIAASDPSYLVPKETIEAMKASLEHRGPNDHGSYVCGNVGLGFRRLSIIDLQGGHQPMSNEDGRLWMVFNGEIYNHREIRGHLTSKGHTFKTNCDAECILHVFEEEGIEGFTRLNGMFAFALWDDSSKRLLLVRDRLGIKPLYYARTSEGVVFASEIKAIFKHDAMKPEMDPEALEEYLIFRYTAGPRTMFRNINALQPGHYLCFENDSLRIGKYWDVQRNENRNDISESDALAQFEELLRDSVKLRLMSDVPLGTFCSGGVDSSLTTAFATDARGSAVDTFSVGFDEVEFDESNYALAVSKRYNTNHHKLTINNKTFADNLPRLIWHHDEPLSHANSVPIHCIADLARQYVTVVLTGEGSDELFAGYPRYIIAAVCAIADGLPAIGKTGLQKAFNLTNFRRLKKLGYFLNLPLDDVALFNGSFNNPQSVAKLMGSSLSKNMPDNRRSILADASLNGADLLERLLTLDLKTYLVALLHRMDKMTMAASIEARVPFLDHRLVEWGAQLPRHLKLRRLTTKYLVKKVAESYVPRDAIYRPKSGFGVPVSDWFRDEKGLGRYLALFDEPEFGQRGFLNTELVRKMVDEHRRCTADHGETLWDLVNLELWYRIFMINGGDYKSLS